MTKDEALKLGLQVVEAAEYLANNPAIFGEYVQEKRALKRALIQRSKISFEEALAQPEQEPVAMRYDFDGYGWLYIDNGSGSNWREKIKNAEPLFTAPPQREWVGLTEEEVSKLIDIEIGFNSCCGWEEEYTRAVEAKLREKNT